VEFLKVLSCSGPVTNNQSACRIFLTQFHTDGAVRSSQISAPIDVFSVNISNSANDRSKTSLSGSSSAVRTGAHHLLDIDTTYSFGLSVYNSQ